MYIWQELIDGTGVILLSTYTCIVVEVFRVKAKSNLLFAFMFCCFTRLSLPSWLVWSRQFTQLVGLVTAVITSSAIILSSSYLCKGIVCTGTLLRRWMTGAGSSISKMWYFSPGKRPNLSKPYSFLIVGLESWPHFSVLTFRDTGRSEIFLGRSFRETLKDNVIVFKEHCTTTRRSFYIFFDHCSTDIDCWSVVQFWVILHF